MSGFISLVNELKVVSKPLLTTANLYKCLGRLDYSKN